MQATSDKTASANFTQTGHSINLIGIVDNVTGDAYGKAGYNNYYQWGRKDAFKSAAHGTASAAGITYSETASTFGGLIKNPTTHYSNSYGGPYGGKIYNNLWNAICTAGGTAITNNDIYNKVVKTVYDPCPVGYTVPPANLMLGFGTSNTTVDGESRYCTGSDSRKLYFPFSGFRFNGYFSSPDVKLRGQIGSYWIAVASTTAGRSLFFYVTSSTVVSSSESVDKSIEQPGYSSSGNNIRPVREN